MKFDLEVLEKMQHVADKAADMHRYAEELRLEARMIMPDESASVHDTMMDLVDVVGIRPVSVAKSVARLQANGLLRCCNVEDCHL